MAGPLPLGEEARLAQLRELLVLDTAPEPVFDSLARLASEVCGTPIALVSLVDAERQWFKAGVGLPGVNETPRDVAFCAHAIHSDALFEVPDATLDPRFADNPLVTAAPDIRFYAGAPLVLPGGERIGTLCVIDRQARHLDPAQAQMLRSLAVLTVQALVMRRALVERTLAARSDYEKRLADSEAQYRAMLDLQSELVSLAQPDGSLVYVNPAYARHFGRSVAAMLGTNLFDFIEPADVAAVRERIDWVLATGENLSADNRMVAADGSERWVAWTNTRQHDTEGRPLLHSVGRDVSARKRAERALRASEAFLARTGRVAGVGGWELDLASGEILWSDETRRIHEVGADYRPTLDSAIQFYAPAARPLLEAAVRAATESGTPWDMELPFVTATGRQIWVRAVGEAEFDGDAPVRLVGAFQDITERRQLQQRLADSERFLREITDSLPVRIAYVDAERRYRFVNLAHCRRFGLPREGILGRTRVELRPGHSDARIDAFVDAALAGQPQRFEFDEMVGGERHRFESQLIPDRAEDGSVRGFFSTGVDITARTAAALELQRQGATLRTVTEAIPAIVSVVDRELRYRFVNGAFERWYGLVRERVLGRPARAVLPPADIERSRPWAERALAGETVQFERDYPAREGRPHLAVSYIPLRLDDGRVDGFIGVAQDITQLRHEHLRLQQLAQRDALTGLLNRAGFESAIELRLQDGDAASLALLYIDLDRFKPVNDQHGHPVGDTLLQHVAQRLAALVRPSDAVARLGGDEFAVLLAGLREAGHAHTVAGKVVAALGAPFEIGGLQLQIGASVGVAFGAQQGWRELVGRADAALYRAKQEGRGRVAD